MAREVTLKACSHVNSAREAIEGFEDGLIEWEDPSGERRSRYDFERGDLVWLVYRTNSKPLRHQIRW